MVSKKFLLMQIMHSQFVLIDTAMMNLYHQTDVHAGVPDSEVVIVH